MEMTVEQSKFCLDRNTSCRDCELNNTCTKGKRTAYYILEQDKLNKALEENEKLKEGLKFTNEYLMRISKEYEDMQEIANKLDEELRKAKSQMSAVEVLEFLTNKPDTLLFMIFAEEDIDGICKAYTPQEIVDKITEYEKNHIADDDKMKEPQFKVGDWVRCISTNDCGEITRIASYLGEIRQVEFNGKWSEVSDCEHAEPQFELGKYYKHTTGEMLHIVGKVETMMYGECFVGESTNCLNLKPIGIGEGYSDGFSEISKEEFESSYLSETEEPQAEWVYECYCDVNIFYCRDEEFAIRWCERKSKEIGTESYYRKVCRLVKNEK